MRVRICTWSIVVFVAVMLPAAAVLAAEHQPAKADLQPAKKEEAKPQAQPLPVHTYRIEGLFMKRDWSAGRLGLPDVIQTTATEYMDYGNAGGLFGKKDGEADKKPLVGPPALIQIITRTINHRTCAEVAEWSDEDGAGAIEYLTLTDAVVIIVAQTPTGHKLIADLLEQLHKETDEGGPLLLTSTRWVELDEGKVPQLMGKDPKRAVPLVVTDADLEKAGAKTVYRASTTCFDQQTVFMASGNLKAYLGDGTPVVAEGAVGIDPNIMLRLLGGMVEVRPKLLARERTVVLDYRSYMNHSGKIDRKPLPDFACVSGQPTPMRVDLEYPEVDFQTLRGSVCVPLDKTVVLGCTTGPNLKGGKVLALVVEVSASQ
jgi:hypothetical protein